jgi:hypothetical protein
MSDADNFLVSVARRFVSALRFRHEDEFRVAVLNRVARELGEGGYPTFLKLLMLIEESDDQAAKRVVAQTLGCALERFNLPGGRLTSWGATRLPASAEPVPAKKVSACFYQGAPERRLGPVEYLTVWFCQRTQRANLDAGVYASSLSQLISLINLSNDARTLYPQKLQAIAGHEIEGAFTRTARQKLQDIAVAWQAKEPPQGIASRAVGNGDIAYRTAPLDWLMRRL